jgi:hypothetical protein
MENFLTAEPAVVVPKDEEEMWAKSSSQLYP